MRLQMSRKSILGRTRCHDKRSRLYQFVNAGKMPQIIPVAKLQSRFLTTLINTETRLRLEPVGHLPEAITPSRTRSVRSPGGVFVCASRPGRAPAEVSSGRVAKVAHFRDREWRSRRPDSVHPHGGDGMSSDEWASHIKRRSPPVNSCRARCGPGR